MYSRQEIVSMTDTQLKVAYDGTAGRLRSDWSRGAPGRVSDCFLLGLLLSESSIRGLAIAPLVPFEQLRLDV